MHRFVRSSVLALALLAVTATATFAHECFVADRGSTGSQQAGTQSKTWAYFTLQDLAPLVGQDFGITLTPNQVDYFVARAQELGVPGELALFFGNEQSGGHTIADNRGFTKNGKGVDGKGIDHFFTAHFEAVATAFMEAAEQPA